MSVALNQEPGLICELTFTLFAILLGVPI